MGFLDRIRAMISRGEQQPPNSANKREEREAAQEALDLMSRKRQ